MNWSSAIQLTGAIVQAHPAQIQAWAPSVESALGAGASHEIARLLHLFLGFPRIVLAFNAIHEVVGDSAPLADFVQPGETVFAELYEEHADKVLTHLRKLDPIFAQWIVDHAYGRVLSRRRLDLNQIERLALLCLAETRCWKQWDSHFIIAQRIGVSRAELREDLSTALSWLAADASRELERRLAGT